MKKHDLLSLLAPIALMILGVILFFVPDTGSILLSKILGWGLTLAGMAAFLWAIFTRDWSKLVVWFLLVSAGSALLAKPLALAAFVGRILGALLALRSIRELIQSATTAGKFLAGALILVGAVLILMPMSASRLVFSGCGVVLVLCGGAQLLQWLREKRNLPIKRDDIIDAL